MITEKSDMYQCPLEAEILRSEFWFEIKILFYKSTPANTKMASELKLDAKYNIFISKILDRSIDLEFY